MIDYEALAQDAMRGVIRTVLTRITKSGLPGDHHFYISFDTQVPGVILSKRLKEKYPEEMTIVLQHRFWDLAVSDERFEVKLTFDGIPERLIVPFAALKVFFDPSVRYGLQFEAPDFGPDAISHPQSGRNDSVSPAAAQGTTAFRSSSRAPTERKPRAARKPRTEKVSEPNLTSLEAGDTQTAVPSTKSRSDEIKPAAKADEAEPVVLNPPAPSSAEIVSLDAFRKK